MSATRSQEWRSALQGVIPRPRPGGLSAVQAVIHWATSTPGDVRMHHLIDAPDDARGGEIVGRALRAGGWGGDGLDELLCALADPEALVHHYLDLRSQQGWHIG